MDPRQKARLREFFNKLADKPLEPDDPFYEPFVATMSDGDPIETLATRILWSEAASVHLLSGQRGSGKSTELRRLRKTLHDQGCEVFLCDMRDYMNLTTPVEITDFFISIMGALNDAVQERYDKEPARESYWDRLIHFLLTEVEIKDLKIEGNIGVGKVGISASLKDDPSFKQRLQAHLRGHVARLVLQAHEFATEVVTLIRQSHANPDKKVVLLIDSVEQIRGVGAEAGNVYKSVENLFSGHAESLHFSSLHVVYTIPPYLTPLTPGLGRQLGGGMVCNLPSVHIRTRKGDPDPSGLATMQQIMQRRYATWREIFTLTQLERMALMTGGDLRDFFRFAKDCLTRAASLPEARLPLPDKVLQDAENHLRRDMLPIAAEDADWLRRIAASKEPELESIRELPRLARFFDTNLVLNYRNAEDWYDIHPLLPQAIGETRP
jgi:hypothetical protein